MPTLWSPPNYDLPNWWSVTAPPGINTTYCSVPHCYDIPVVRCPPPWAPGAPWCATDKPLEAFGDYRNALFAVERLKQLAEHANGQLWFAAVGMHHPHLKWRVPKQYWGRISRSLQTAHASYGTRTTLRSQWWKT